MPSFDLFKRMQTSQGSTIGQIHKANSNIGMEMTWDNNIQSKLCYIYDYFHDDKPHLCRGMTYENTTKTPIDAKFIITQYGSLAKDQVEYHIQFRPSQKTSFSESDDLYYFEEYRNRYGSQFPIGQYIDIPNEDDIYEKWLICSKEIGNQFIKYSILPCDYHLYWIENNGKNRIKRDMWCISRAMNSYTTGIYIDRYINSLDDVQKIWLPMNSITEKISYVNGENNNMRLIVSACCEKPLTWKVSKIENTKPIGIIKITLDQDVFNPHTDFVDRTTREMYANYYSSIIPPAVENNDDCTTNDRICKIETTNTKIKIGGSYKLLSASIFEDNTNVTNEYFECTWRCLIDGEDITDSDLVKWLNQSEFNKIKIKFSNDRTYLGKILTIQCIVSDIIGEIQLQISI